MSKRKSPSENKEMPDQAQIDEAKLREEFASASGVEELAEALAKRLGEGVTAESLLESAGLPPKKRKKKPN